jgi:putative selenium metabolism hydrolase
MGPEEIDVIPNEKILAAAKKLRDYTAENLAAMIRIPSLSAEEGPVVEAIARMAESAGFDEVRVDGLGNLIARIGHGPRILAIDAHVDTVDTGDLSQWEHDPFSGLIQDDQVYGRGSVDQEGGAAAMITAGRILKESGYDGEWSIYFTFTVMEEDCDGLCWNYLIEEEKLVPEFAVITEPTNLGIYRGHRGRMEIDVVFSGLSAHGSAPERGDNAIYHSSRAALGIEELNTRLAPDPFLGKGSAVVSRFRSSAPSLCAVADGADLHIDRRLTWGETRETALAEVAGIVAPPDGAAAADAPGKPVVSVTYYDRKGYTGNSYPQESYFPTWKIEEDHPLVQAGAATFTALFNESPNIDKWTFSTNGVAICGKHGIPTIGFGPGNEIYAHAPNESTPIDHLEKAAAFYALLPYILEEQL